MKILTMFNLKMFKKDIVVDQISYQNDLYVLKDPEDAIYSDFLWAKRNFDIAILSELKEKSS